jgi:hypothetical protein
MKRYFAIAVYRSLVAGKPTGSLDIQVRYYLAESEQRVRDLLHGEERHSYENPRGEVVEWELRAIMDVEEAAELETGEEIVGFIVGPEELAELAGQVDPGDGR